MSRLQLGYIFDGRYKLLKKLGEGGFSEVWLVEDTSAQITLVLKVFLPASQLDETGIEMFRQEFALVYNMNHPNLLKYTYFGVCVGHPYLVMPYYNSGSAEDLLGNCSERKAWKFLHDVASGLACLHEHQPPIIHQDIKPANVLLDGTSFIITDFGISANVRHMLGDSAEGKSMVQGTRPYMPPEKFQPNPIPLVASDIWALGASMYEMLTGRLPFGGKGGQSQLEGADIPQLSGNFSDDLKEVVAQCMSPSPSDRPFATDLEKFAYEKLANYTTGSVGPNTGGVGLSSVKISGSQSITETPSVSSQVVPVKKRGLMISVGVGALVLVIVGVLLAALLHKETDPNINSYEEAMSYYRRGVQFYHQGVSNTQGQLEKFKNSIECFGKAQSVNNPEFQESEYADSINVFRGQMFDYCMDEAKRNYSAAFYEDGLRGEVIHYLEVAKSISDTKEVKQLIDSLKYVYISEEF